MEALQRLHNRGSISTGSYEIENSSVWESDLQDQAYVTQGGTAGTRTKHTWSMWIKRTELGTRQMLFEGGTSNSVTTQLSLSFQTTDALEVRAGEYVNGSTAGTVYRLTNRVFRDTSAWYHIVAAFDTTQGTANDRIKIWVNGVQETSFATTANPGQNTNLGVFAANAQSSIGVSANNAFYVNGYIAHPALVYNAQLNADSFGEFDEDSGIWKPIDLEDVTFGTYGYWMKNEIKNGAGSGMATDSSGNSKTFANWDDTIYQSTDTPTNNFCTMNNNSRTNGNIRTQEGGTQVTADGGSGWVSMNATMGVQAGKWYWEVRYENTSDANNTMVGIAASNDAYIPHRSGGYYLGNVATSGSHGWLFKYSTVFNMSGTWSDLSAGDIAMVALDCDNGKLYFGVNGTWKNSSNPATNSNGGNYAGYQGALTEINPFMIPSVSLYQGKRIKFMNFGGHTGNPISSAETDENDYGTFEYAPPTGFYALCSKNLAEFG
jgi:hypothetical protein